MDVTNAEQVSYTHFPYRIRNFLIRLLRRSFTIFYTHSYGTWGAFYFSFPNCFPLFRSYRRVSRKKLVLVRLWHLKGCQRTLEPRAVLQEWSVHSFFSVAPFSISMEEMKFYSRRITSLRASILFPFLCRVIPKWSRKSWMQSPYLLWPKFG